MNIALTHIHAAASARFCGRLAFVRAIVLGCAMACVGAPAFADQDRDRDARHGAPQQDQHAGREQPRGERMPPPVQRVEPRQYEAHGYDPRAEEQQRRQAAQQQEQGRRGGRLTPDERRELRRQINEAGVDLYPNAPRR
jgi:hypothetical protein